MPDRLKTVIVDDELHCIETLRWQLEKYCPEVEVLAAFSNPVEGLKYLMYHQVDLLFLDIEMPVLNGFDLLRSLNKRDLALVFTTAYDEFAIKAIKHRAIDYLLKPVDVEELRSAIKGAIQSRTDMEQRVSLLMKDMSVQEADRVALHNADGVVMVEHHRILRCESDSNYMHVFLNDGQKITISRTLKEVEEQIGSTEFLRVHQSHLVNFKHVVRYEREGKLVLSDQSSVPVSRRKRSELLERI